MSTRRITYRACNGCGDDELNDGVNIVESKPYLSPPLSDDGRTLDICDDCVEVGLYICRLCRSVHDDEHPCEAMALMDQALFEPSHDEPFDGS